jgi:VWFA-related protein
VEFARISKRAMNHNTTSIRFRILLGLGCFCVSMLVYSQDYRNPVLLQESNDAGDQDENKSIVRVGVEEVRLDAVVLDRKGHQITDLTADDFEVYQDNKKQQIIASKYISDFQSSPVSRHTSSPEAKAARAIPAPRLTPDEVRRTIIFLVDDVSLRRFPEVYRARMCLRKYVEEQMQPGDLVAILQTHRGASALSAFTSEKSELLIRINNIHWIPPYELPAELVTPLLHEEFIPQPLAIDYCINALKEMPGRKYLILMSNNALLFGTDAWCNRLADSALQAGIVIHTMDMFGLEDASVSAEPKPSPLIVSGRNPHLVRYVTDLNYSAAQMYVRRKFKELPLSQKTGGVLLTGGNYYLNGIGDFAEEMKGYYLLSYIPPASTFSDKNRNIYKKIRVKVKRSGARVHTRDGFIGFDRSLETLEEERNPLIKAMFSPFQYQDLSVNMTSGYVADSIAGYNLRAWIHLDGYTLGITDIKDGTHSISLEAVAATSSIDGIMRDSAKKQLTMELRDIDLEWIRAHGLNFSLSLHKDKPGAYYIRVAIKDQISGSIGSAYEFIEIPDLAKETLALSSIFVLNSSEDLAWARMETTKGSWQSQPDDIQYLIVRNQALRKYKPGERFEYMAVLYNLKSKVGMPPDLETQVVLFGGDGRELYKSEPESVQFDNSNNLKRIPIRKSLLLERMLQPGNYILKLQVHDRRAKGQSGIVEQLMQFEISAN